jgi:hypothetical protein
MYTKECQNHIPKLFCQVAMNEEMINGFPINLAQTAPVHQHYPSLSQIVIGEYFP